jgi:phosphoglycolate phosphatase-like HAD superfamily hydrolase
MHYEINKLTTLLWDFDGVILDSMPVREIGFVEIFKEFPKSQVDDLLHFHNVNGGWSRYVKIEHFFKNIAEVDYTKQDILDYAENFSKIMKKELTHPKRLIADSVDYIKHYHNVQNFHVVSGSDGTELNFLCKELGIAQYFLSIHGSPTPKIELVKNLMEKHSYDIKSTGLIGDSHNDHEAASENDILFYGYNNEKLKPFGKYVENLSSFIPLAN